MLTITAPIKTALKSDLTGASESFAKRIIANYDQLSEFIDREDLFHVVTQPPEIFLMDAGNQSFLSETEVHNNQMKKVEIINNLMNRILVSADGNLTYQDEVYITNVLHKLGIRDEKVFMKKVYQLTEETKNNNRLIDSYWNNLEELRQMVYLYKSTEQLGDNIQTTETAEQILHLHEDVFKRWMTGALYRIQNNFRMSTDNSTYIDADSYRMTDEQRLSQQILLQRLRETVRGESVPLIYRHDNYYEVPDMEAGEVDSEAIAGQIASAVLLSLVDNIYENLANKNTTISDRFYHTENAYFQAAEHVFERMEGNTAYIISQKNEGDLYAERQEHITQELYQISVLNEERQRQYVESIRTLVREHDVIAGEHPADADRIAESMFAFTHPEEFRAAYEEGIRAGNEAATRSEEAFIERLPDQTREIFKVIEGYLREPEAFAQQYRITKGGEIFLYRESILAERAEQITRETEKLTEVIENDRVIRDQAARVEEMTERGETETVSLVHRINEVSVDEDTIESLRQQIRHIENETQRIDNVVTNTEATVTQQVNNYNETLVTQQDNDQLIRMIQKNVGDQIGTITNKVYSRIERQLMSERRRRGM